MARVIDPAAPDIVEDPIEGEVWVQAEDATEAAAELGQHVGVGSELPPEAVISVVLVNAPVPEEFEAEYVDWWWENHPDLADQSGVRFWRLRRKDESTSDAT
jgi:hypothetical protein